MSELQQNSNVIDGVFDEKDFFADPKKNKRILVPTLDRGDQKGWIEVREEISIREERRVFAGAMRGQTQTKDGEIRNEFDIEKVSFGNVVLYLTAWSLKKVLNADAIMALKPAIYKAIDDAVDGHMKAIAAGKAQTPSSSGGAPTSSSAA